jgi:hypothetical protein
LKLRGELAPAIKKFATIMFRDVLPILLKFASVLATVIGKVADFGASLLSGDGIKDGLQAAADAVFNPTKSIRDAVDEARSREPREGGAAASSEGIPEFLTDAGWTDVGTSPVASTPKPAPGADDAPESKGGPSSEGDPLDLVIRSLEKSIVPQAQVTSIAQASRHAQMAALNADPIEALMLKAMMDTLATMKEVAVNTKDSRMGAE